MRITFVALGMEQLSVSLLSSIAQRQGHETSLVFSRGLFQDRYNLDQPFLAKRFDDRVHLIDRIIQLQPDVLCCSVLTSTYQWMLETVRLAKSRLPDLKVVFGGIHPSACGEQVLEREEVDYVCQGEGDIAFPAILKAIEQGDAQCQIPNVLYKTEQGKIIRGPIGQRVADLSALPVFDKRLWEQDINVGDLYLTMTSRGCPFGCAFCFNNFFRKLKAHNNVPYIRRRSIDHVMEELMQTKQRYRLRCIAFEDDAFTMDKSWLRSFLDHYRREIHVSFQCLAHSQFVDEDVVKWLAEAGCVWVEMGVQSADEEYKKIIYRKESNERIVQGINAFIKAGIRVRCDHIFGLPGEPIENQETARKVYARATPTRITTNWAAYYPGTDLVRLGLKYNDLSSSDADAINEGTFTSTFHPTSHDVDSKKISQLSVYMFLFRLMPVLPKSLRKALKPAHIQWMPLGAINLLGFLVDAIWGLISRNPEHWAYLRQNAHFLATHFRLMPERRRRSNAELR